ncbi:hypothetical protein R1sor_013210 [Riccia sorocarpa]|uniref:Uncharacterized protein n=1 Tax=Riccia sorocarpa TaxID=122646 RepID=A0ABD3H7R3_9MARC
MASVVAASSVIAPAVGVSASPSVRTPEIISVQAGLEGSVFSGKSEWQSKTHTNGSRVSCMQGMEELCE